MSFDTVPYIGQYAKNTPYLFVAAGFNKWGMTSSMAAAEILADLITNRKNDFADVFSPSRSMLKLQLSDILPPAFFIIFPHTEER